MTEALEAHLRRQIEHSRRFFWQRLRWRVVRSYLPDGPLTLVDVGAGAGLLGVFVARDRPQAMYRFVEPIPSLRTYLRQCYGEQADVGDDQDYASADVVTLLDVLEHQEMDREFLEALVGKMAPGATLVITVPAKPELWSQWDVVLGHFRRYDKTTLRNCMADLPLTVREISFLFPEMVPLAWLRKKRSADATGEDEAEFPDLPLLVNDLIYGMGSASLSLRRYWNTGTSLLAVATVDA